MGRGAAGVRGIKLPEGHEVIAVSIVQDGLVLTATENGYGKRTSIEDFPVQGRGGQGVIAIQTTARNGRTVGAVLVAEDDEIMLISSDSDTGRRYFDTGPQYSGRTPDSGRGRAAACWCGKDRADGR
jgi:DNA gyrase/topoisomerase IV subunit A